MNRIALLGVLLCCGCAGPDVLPPDQVPNKRVPSASGKKPAQSQDAAQSLPKATWISVARHTSLDLIFNHDATFDRNGYFHFPATTLKTMAVCRIYPRPPRGQLSRREVAPYGYGEEFGAIKEIKTSRVGDFAFGPWASDFFVFEVFQSSLDNQWPASSPPTPALTATEFQKLVEYVNSRDIDMKYLPPMPRMEMPSSRE